MGWLSDPGGDSAVIHIYGVWQWLNNIKYLRTQVSVIPGANHGFTDYENELVAAIDSFLTTGS